MGLIWGSSELSAEPLKGSALRTATSTGLLLTAAGQIGLQPLLSLLQSPPFLGCL